MIFFILAVLGFWQSMAASRAQQRTGLSMFPFAGIVIGCLLLVASGFELWAEIPHARAADYPTVRELESGLGIYPGTQFQKDVPARNRGWHVYYLSARSLGNGLYDVRVKLK